MDKQIERKKYYCGCKAKCSGIEREVSRATYFRHAEHWDPLSKYTPETQSFLRQFPTVTQASLSHTAQHLHVHKDGASEGSPINKQMHRSSDNTDNEDIAVGTFGRVLKMKLIILT